jgi:hypothetical protein
MKFCELTKSPRPLQNAKFPYGAYRSPHYNLSSAHTPIWYFIKISFIIILPCMSGSLLD